MKNATCPYCEALQADNNEWRRELPITKTCWHCKREYILNIRTETFYETSRIEEPAFKFQVGEPILFNGRGTMGQVRNRKGLVFGINGRDTYFPYEVKLEGCIGPIPCSEDELTKRTEAEHERTPAL